MFPFKDRVSHRIRESKCIYKINCKDCNAFYIGKTCRIQGYRVKEHRTACTQKKENSVFYHHIQQNKDHEIDFDNVEVIDKAKNDYQLKLKEQALIIKLKPALNIQLGNGYKEKPIKTLIIPS